MTMKSLPAYALTLTLVLAGTLARAQTAQPAAERTVLVELFTSEGCSSCPPADQLLTQIHNKQIGATLVVGISEHVTYWNHDGWSDPFSDDVFTERQNAYGLRFNLSSVYTPQMIVNGERQVLGSDRKAVLQAVHSASPASPLKLHIVSAKADGQSLQVTFAVEGQKPSQNADIYAIVTDDFATSKVLRGENSGHILSHVSVARSITRVGSLKDLTAKTVTLPLQGATAATSGSGRHLILFAQEPRAGNVLAIENKAL